MMGKTAKEHDTFAAPTRYEVKMTCNEVYLPDLRAWLRLNREAFCHSYPERRVNNIYFDTPELDCIQDNGSGTGRRAKLRLRWYGEDLVHVRGALELKGKVAQQGWKLISDPITLDLSSGAWCDVLPRLRAQTDGRMAMWLDALAQPVLINRYWREYYESGDRQLRITVDWDQVAYDQLSYSHPNVSAPSRDIHEIVVEVKGDGRLSKRISDLLSTFPLRTARNSKYVSGALAALPW
jgi:hypothetical protein